MTELDNCRLGLRYVTRCADMTSVSGFGERIRCADSVRDVGARIQVSTIYTPAMLHPCVASLVGGGQRIAQRPFQPPAHDDEVLSRGSPILQGNR